MPSDRVPQSLPPDERSTPDLAPRYCFVDVWGVLNRTLAITQQNVSMLQRMVQQLGTGRDTSELRNQCQHQLQVVDELRGKIQAQVCTYGAVKMNVA